MESFRKAYGALKDSTTVGLANLNSNFKDLDVAIIKATNHNECPPKERHIQRIIAAVSINRPRADVAYSIHALSRRLSRTRNWIVAVKTLIVVHRTLREGDPTFREELLQFNHRGKLFQIPNFKDVSSSLAWDCSAWVRTYALFLEERLDCFRTLKFDVEAEKVQKPPPGQPKGYSRTRHLSRDQLLHHLPALQQLLYRLLCCQPEGAACYNYLIQYALALVLKESFKIYCSINDGIINLVDMFFDMPKHDTVKALNIYKKAGKQAEHLAEFYDFCRTLELAQTFQFPMLRQPPPTFLATMEEYIREAPQIGSLSLNTLEYYEAEEEPEELPDESEEQNEGEGGAVEEVQEEQEPEIKEETSSPMPNEPIDLLGLNELNPEAMQIEENNALALAIQQHPGGESTQPTNALADIGKMPGWELALVTTPSTTNKPQAPEPQLGGGFDKLLLDSLYEDNLARRALQMHSAGYSTREMNPFEQHQHDPFGVSSGYAPPLNVQMAMMSQHEQMMYQQQQQQQQQAMSMMLPPGQGRDGHPAYGGNPFACPPGPSQGNNGLI